jgi:hypothetical protein
MAEQANHTNCGAQGHVHGPDCGHPAVEHNGHTDYVVNGRLHHQHGDHCHDHGPAPVEAVSPVSSSS